MFDDRNESLKNIPAVRKEQKKILPYTVTEIKDIDVWREARKAKFAEDERKRAERFNDVVNRLQASMDQGTQIEQSEEIKTMIANEEKDMATANNAYAGGVGSLSRKEAVAQINASYTAPWYKRLADKVINFFMNINFGN